ncbi:DoxX family protein [Arthrobacter sp. NPDC090010]|uniref:DoxX family protein n=1 Tax=Arthrobacter sp. NPDC090010 TaxID=3363942 RepID=UPI00381935E3
MASTSTSRTTDTALAVLRIALGVVFFAHGWQKVFEFTLPGVQGSFGQMGVPAAEIAGPAIAFLELIGGAALVLGLVTRVVGALLALDMLGAIVLVHAQAGLFVDQGGMELVLVLGVGALALAIAGAGRFSLDALVFGRRGSRIAASA